MHPHYLTGYPRDHILLPKSSFRCTAVENPHWSGRRDTHRDTTRTDGPKYPRKRTCKTDHRRQPCAPSPDSCSAAKSRPSSARGLLPSSPAKRDDRSRGHPPIANVSPIKREPQRQKAAPPWRADAMLDQRWRRTRLWRETSRLVGLVGKAAHGYPMVNVCASSSATFRLQAATLL
jgi:hypothetical protein